jgi:hypothetical protein
MARCRLQTPHAVAGLETVSELVDVLPSVIRNAERTFLTHVKAFPPQAPTSGGYPIRPRLRGQNRPDSATRPNSAESDEIE